MVGKTGVTNPLFIYFLYDSFTDEYMYLDRVDLLLLFALMCNNQSDLGILILNQITSKIAKTSSNTGCREPLNSEFHETANVECAFK